jgi:hypothetical protein
MPDFDLSMGGPEVKPHGLQGRQSNLHDGLFFAGAKGRRKIMARQHEKGRRGKVLGRDPEPVMATLVGKRLDRILRPREVFLDQ